MMFLRNINTENMLVSIVYGFTFGVAYFLGIKFVDNVFVVNQQRYVTYFEKCMDDQKRSKKCYDKVMLELILKSHNNRKQYYKSIINEWKNMMDAKVLHKEKYNHVMHELMNRDMFDFEKMESEQTEYYDNFRKRYLMKKQMENYDKEEYLKALESKKQRVVKKEFELQQELAIKKLFDKL